VAPPDVAAPGAVPGGDHAADAARVAASRQRNGLAALIDIHVHFMPQRLLAAVQAYFDSAGPLIGRPWPIAYRQDEDARVAILRGFGVRAFTAMLYPHKPGPVAGSVREHRQGREHVRGIGMAGVGGHRLAAKVHRG
jgi:hypothetical protein